MSATYNELYTEVLYTETLVWITGGRHGWMPSQHETFFGGGQRHPDSPMAGIDYMASMSQKSIHSQDRDPPKMQIPECFRLEYELFSSVIRFSSTGAGFDVVRCQSRSNGTHQDRRKHCVPTRSRLHRPTHKRGSRGISRILFSAAFSSISNTRH